VKFVRFRFACENDVHLEFGVAYIPKPWQPLNVLVAAEQALVLAATKAHQEPV
jgi:hypothetical protein